jgi:two-component system, NarL family, nitrate/nitrite response regulator NarL
MATRVLVVAGVRLYREGLSQLLVGRPEIAVVGAAASGKTAVAGLADSAPDVVLLDMDLDDAAETIHTLVHGRHPPHVLALGMLDSDESIVACLEAGAAGYIDREASLDELLERLDSAARGEMRCSPSVAASLARRLATVVDHASEAPPQASLTRREREIVALIELGLSNKEIARKLFIEVSTVKNHVHHILEKLNVSRRGEAAARARRAPFPERRVEALRD